MFRKYAHKDIEADYGDKHFENVIPIQEQNEQMSQTNIWQHSFFLNISIALLQGDYSGAIPIPVRQKGKFLV